MANVFDVAAYILKSLGTTTTMKLQKLVYYAQAWSLVWDEDPLFPERIEAWANGPVAPDLFRAHKGSFKVSRIRGGDPDALTADQSDTVDAIVDVYGSKPSHELSELTHSEDPWRDAREGCGPGESCEMEITPAAMHEYYDSLCDE